jgi:acyl-lipid omega-6 desaturase (Delta-12 desaturase)
MNKTQYLEIRRKLNFDRPLWITLVVIAADLLLVVLAFWLLGLQSLPAYLLSQLLLALFFFHSFSILHECVHGNVHKKQLVNSLIGHYASLFCFFPYFPWRYIHTKHHQWAGNLEKDPVLVHLRRWRELNHVPWIARFGWKSWMPISGFLQQFVYWLYPITMWREGSMNRQAFFRSVMSIGWSISGYVLLFMLFPAQVNFANLWLSLLLYLVAVELVNLPHHVGMPTLRIGASRDRLKLWDQHETTRSCHYPGLLSELLVLNFNIHTEHHLFPDLPWYRLKRARSLVKPVLGDEHHEVVGIGWNVDNRARSATEVFLKEEGTISSDT